MWKATLNSNGAQGLAASLDVGPPAENKGKENQHPVLHMTVTEVLKEGWTGPMTHDELPDVT